MSALAATAGLSVERRRLTAELCGAATELLVVNSLRGVRAVGWCGQTSWDAPGIVATELMRRYAAFVAQFNWASDQEPL